MALCCKAILEKGGRRFRLVRKVRSARQRKWVLNGTSMSTKRTRKCPEASGRQKRTAGRCRSIADLRAAALHRLPRAVFDFVDGGADDERTLRGYVAADRKRVGWGKGGSGRG